MRTVFHYRYRDANNFKAHGSLALPGGLTDREVDAIRNYFARDDLFIAEQIDVPPLYHQLQSWSGGPTTADHCWHEFVGFELSEGEAIQAEGPLFGDAKSFLNRLLAVKDWDEGLARYADPMGGSKPCS